MRQENDDPTMELQKGELLKRRAGVPTEPHPLITLVPVSCSLSLFCRLVGLDIYIIQRQACQAHEKPDFQHCKMSETSSKP